MASDPPKLPPKPEVALALLQTAASVFVHLDPRGEDVLVPPGFKKQAQLVLQVGLNMVVPIPDLDVGDEGITCTLSFNQRPQFCRLPWGAIYGLVGEDGRGMIWPESVPPEVAASADGRSPTGVREKDNRPKLRLAGDKEDPASTDPEPKATEESMEEKSSIGEEQSTVAKESGVEGGSESPPDDASTTKNDPKSESKSGRPSYLRLVK